ncbi:hypothetical protein KX928_03685 [Roseobacter sp. YSTF-M11]|uniref:Uncharacterized protein n=1 Tax=Roseobacter insulae TaxID=2859783 RepID=A0A9X1FU12_9RHOB|nr:hypothetical protein [Roseobacter insulae]MBW4706883.1 hypothetical protein [Roseobacter insulae]
MSTVGDVHVLSRIAPGAAIIVCATLGIADEAAGFGCQSDVGASEVCVPFVGCVGEQGDFFTGRALGRSEGTLAVETDSGTFCSGEWVPRNFIGVGQANFSCDDGRIGIAYFTYQDPRTGTATGHGLLSDGSKLRVWTGNNIRQFLAVDPNNPNGNLTCANSVVPIS